MSTPRLTPEPHPIEPIRITAQDLLADASRHRLVLEATLAPISGDRIQPAGFPEIGHVIYDAPRPDGAIEKVCIMDSAASMANHLESACRASAFDPALHPDLDGLPFVECRTDADKLVATSLTEGHRLASSYFLEAIVGGDKTFEKQLLEDFGLRDLGKKTHPLAAEWWNVFRVLFKYDPNSLVHGILFPKWAIKLPRLLTAHHEAFGVERVGSAGVKFDRLGKTNSGQPIFAVDEEIAREIRATFVLDVALARSFGRDDAGLGPEQKVFLLEFALWKIQRLLAAPFRFRSNCDLELLRLQTLTPAGRQPAQLGVDVPAALKRAYGETGDRITRVHYPAAKLFKSAATGATPTTGEGEDEEGESPDED